MYQVHSGLQTFSAEFRRNIIHDDHTLVGLLPAESRENYSTSQGIGHRDRSERTTISRALNDAIRKFHGTDLSFNRS